MERSKPLKPKLILAFFWGAITLLLYNGEEITHPGGFLSKLELRLYSLHNYDE